MTQIATGDQRLDAAWRYVLSIRNFDKREYGIQYLEFLRGCRDEPREPRELSLMAARAIGWSQNKHNDAIKVRGAGMDMGFHLVNTLSYALYGRSNALKHRWL